MDLRSLLKYTAIAFIMKNYKTRIIYVFSYMIVKVKCDYLQTNPIIV